MQCGYCVAGILMSAAALLARKPQPSEQEVRTALDRNLCRCGAHNRMVRLLSQEERVPFIETTQALDGQWNDDFYLDIVHFTEAGNERVAGAIFRQLLPILAEREGLHCVLR